MGHMIQPTPEYGAEVRKESFYITTSNPREHPVFVYPGEFRKCGMVEFLLADIPKLRLVLDAVEAEIVQRVDEVGKEDLNKKRELAECRDIFIKSEVFSKSRTSIMESMFVGIYPEPIWPRMLLRWNLAFAQFYNTGIKTAPMTLKDYEQAFQNFLKWAIKRSHVPEEATLIKSK